MFRIFPREETFLPQFGRAAQVIVDAARVLDSMAEEPGTGVDRAAEIKRLEHQGDQIAHETFDLLNRTWITPIDDPYLPLYYPSINLWSYLGKGLDKRWISISVCCPARP